MRRALGAAPLLLISASAFAASGDLNDLTAQYLQLSTNFYRAIESAAYKLLWALFGVELAWFSLQGVLKRQEIGEIMTSLIHCIFPPMLFFTMIKFGLVWLPQIIDSFWFFAKTGTGLDQLDPVAILVQGINLQNEMVTRYLELSGSDGGLIDAIANFFPSLMLTFACIIIMFAFGILALNFFLVQVEAYVAIALAPMLLALAGWRWTRDSAVKVFNVLIAIGVKIVVLMFVIKVAINITPRLAELGAAWTISNWTPLWLVAFTTIGLALLAIFAPKMAANLLSGQSSLSAGDSVAGAAMVAGAALGAAGLAVRPAGQAAGQLASGAGELARGARDTLGRLAGGTPGGGRINPLDGLETANAASMTLGPQFGSTRSSPPPASPWEQKDSAMSKVKDFTPPADTASGAQPQQQEKKATAPDGGADGAAAIGGVPQQEKKSMLDRVAEVGAGLGQSGRGVLDRATRAGQLDSHQAGGDVVKLRE